MQKSGELMGTLRRILSLCAIVLAAAGPACAQYYSWGADAASLRWRTIRTDDVQLIFPDTLRNTARRTLHYIDAARPTIGYGFDHGALRLPFVMHPENLRSNGLVMWLPKRVEFLTPPAIQSYSMPWCKQLVAHEYRHAVQYNNLNRGVIRALSYLIGQQGSTVGLLFLPIWALEGDATLMETRMSSFGRGLQPSFTMEYRAIGPRILERRNSDIWFCGSYRTHVPDHYRLGYQITAYADTRYGENIWNRVARHSVHNPYLIFTTDISLKKFYGTSVRELFAETFSDLNFYWNTHPAPFDSTHRLDPAPFDSYTTYAHPLPVDRDRIVSLKTDFDRPTRLVAVDRTDGREREIAYTGSISTRPAADGRRLWWTEYRRSLLFEERVGSRLCYLDLDRGRPRTVPGRRNVLYPTPTAQGLALVTYDPDGRFHIVCGEKSARMHWDLPDGTEVHGLAWDDRTRRLYFLATDDSGMWIGRAEPDGTHTPLFDGAYITLSDLRAGDGRLYYGSIASGRDEAHCYDLATGREYRLTESRFGSFSPAPLPDGRIVATTYDADGYHLSVQDADTLHPVRRSRLPQNRVNPPRRQWPVANLDTVRFTAADSAASSRRHRSRRYSKALHLLKVHSWTPLAFDPFEAVEEHEIDPNLGVTLLSQNLLSSAEGYLAYSWNRTEGSVIEGRIRYTGLGVHIDLAGTYGGNQVIYSLSQTGADGKPEQQARPTPDKYRSVSTGLTLPLVFERGYRTRTLSLAAAWNFSNGKIADVDKLVYDPETHRITNLQHLGYTEGLHKITFGIGYSDYARSAHRDFAPPHGYLLSANYTFDPADGKFSDLISGYGKLYTPGFFRHHSFSVAAAYQTSLGGFRFPSGEPFLTYKSTRLIPRGFTSGDIASRNYFAASLDYQLPLWHPEGGIRGVLYIKRIRLNAGADYAQFDAARTGRTARTRRLHAYGGDLFVDFNIFRQPAAATSTLRLSCYAPDKGGCRISAALGLPF